MGNVAIPSIKAALAPGTYTISNILAHDSNDHPTTLKEILEYVDSRGYMPGRTGWSAYDQICVRNPETGGTMWVRRNEVNTSDSGRDKNYPVAEYRSEIVSAYGVDVYEAALKSGESLKYQDGSKTPSPSGKLYEWYPCDVAKQERSGYYNNSDFMLTLTFKISEGGTITPTPTPTPEPTPTPTPTPSTPGACARPNEVPQRYEHELDLIVNRLDARTVDITTNTNTDVYVERADFSANRAVVKQEFNNYIQQTMAMKSDCESLINTWESEKASLQAEQAACNQIKVPEGGAPPDCSSFVTAISEVTSKINEARSILPIYNQKISLAQSEVGYITSQESANRVINTYVLLDHNGKQVSKLNVSLKEGDKGRYTFPAWKVTEQGKNVIAQINGNGSHNEFKYNNVSNRTARTSLGYHINLGNVLYPNTSSNNWKETKQYVATYTGNSCPVYEEGSYFKTETIKAVVRTVNDNGNKREIEEQLTVSFSKLPRNEMRAGYGFDYTMQSVYKNNDTEPEPSNATGTKNVEGYFPTMVEYQPYKRGGAKTKFDLYGNVIPFGGTDEGYLVPMQTKNPSIARNETKSWILPPVAIEEFSGNIFTVNNEDHLKHSKRNPNEKLLLKDKDGNTLNKWYVDFTESDSIYNFRVRTYDAGVNHLNTCHTGKVLIDGVITGDPNDNDDYVKRSVTTENPFPSGIGWNWTNKVNNITDMSDWYLNGASKPSQIPTEQSRSTFYLTPKTIDAINEYTTKNPKIILGESVLDSVDISSGKD